MNQSTLFIPRKLIWDRVSDRSQYFDAVTLLAQMFNNLGVFMVLSDTGIIEFSVDDVKINSEHITLAYSLLDLIEENMAKKSYYMPVSSVKSNSETYWLGPFSNLSEAVLYVGKVSKAFLPFLTRPNDLHASLKYGNVYTKTSAVRAGMREYTKLGVPKEPPVTTDDLVFLLQETSMG